VSNYCIGIEVFRLVCLGINPARSNEFRALHCRSC
jgi:hypothetical protein